MQPLLIAGQIRQADAYTIAHQSIASLDLMERAAKAFVKEFSGLFPDRNQSLSIYCGTGNNGGDGLAIARLLSEDGYKNIQVKIARFSEHAAPDFRANLDRLSQHAVSILDIVKGEKPPSENSDIIIDALLGTGLNKPLAGDWKRLVEHLNSLNKAVIAVDVPTGFFSDGEIPQDALVLKCRLVISFEQPKINFLLPESAACMDEIRTVHIGIDKEFVKTLHSAYLAVEEQDIRQILKRRHRFTHKGTYGHALLVAGQEETMGAALLCASACANAGCGLTTACIPQSGLTALNSYLPELMAIVRTDQQAPKIEWGKFSAIAIGPGLGKDEDALKLFTDLLINYKNPIVIDADGLNLLATNMGLWSKIPAGSILTPHMKEFDRLFGEHKNWWQRIQTGLKKAQEQRIYVLLKNDYTLIFTPGGKVYFNTSGNPAMATGGMGDVLTGIIASLLAQGYPPEQACLIGAYIHGKAGDQLALPGAMNVVLPGRLAAQLPFTMANLMA